MASPVPAKSHHHQQQQTLPNFPSSSSVKWKKTRSNNPQRRNTKPPNSSDSSPPQPRVNSPNRYSPTTRDFWIRDWAPRLSPMRDSESDLGHPPPTTKRKPESETPKKWVPDNRLHNGFYGSSSVKIVENSDKKFENLEKKSENSEIKLNLRFKVNVNKQEDYRVEKEGKFFDDGKASGVEEVEELVPKTWNLRPRRSICKSLNVNGALKVCGSAVQETKTHQLVFPQGTQSDRMELEGVSGFEKEEKKKKQKFSIGLSRGEIQEDIFALTGSKPARRPKKRPRIVQKTLDNIFPGMWLASVTPDSYKVSENPIKG